MALTDENLAAAAADNQFLRGNEAATIHRATRIPFGFHGNRVPAT